MTGRIGFQTLNDLARAVGLSIVGVADVADLVDDGHRLSTWQDNGYAADMEYMRRDPALLSSPTAVMPTARSIVVFGAFYDRSLRTALPKGFGRVARYAWGRDYHKVLRVRLKRLIDLVRAELKRDFACRAFSDSVPLLERALARRARLGFIGKNTMLIVPRAGSFLFLGEVLWDLEVTDLPHESAESAGKCGTCSRCIDHCPTGAFVSDRVLDARRCISYLTIEKRGELSEAEREWLGEWVFGCDVCQDVCPFNAVAIKLRSPPALEEFSFERGTGQALNLGEVLSIRGDSEFVAKFGGTPLMRAKREGLVRNAAVVAANTSAEALIPKLKEAVLEDSSGVVRQHALWALSKLSIEQGSLELNRLEPILKRCEGDPDRRVRDELSVRVAKILRR